MTETARRPFRYSIVLLALLSALLLTGCLPEEPPQRFWLHAESDFARILQDLFSQIVWAAAFVFVAVEFVLILAIVLFRRGRRGDRLPSQVHGHTTLEILWTIAPAVVLAWVAVPTVRTIFQTYHPETAGTVRIEVIGHQWWWEYHYPDLGITTANEIHMPAGHRATFQIKSADILHEFWIPRLGGKREAIPLHTNELWWTADNPGVYYGQCTQLCGTSHANMRLRAIVHDQAGWDAWVQAMQGASGQPADRVQRGHDLFMNGACRGCHTIQGTPADGKVGPNLTRFGNRITLGAGMYENNLQNLINWIRDPQAAKPGNLMPDLAVSEQDAAAIAAYLLSLK